MVNKINKKENVEKVLRDDDKEKQLNFLLYSYSRKEEDKELRSTPEYKEALQKILDNEDNMIERLNFIGVNSNFKIFGALDDYLKDLPEEKQEEIVKNFLFLK
jgi:hypothetical protein